MQLEPARQKGNVYLFTHAHIDQSNLIFMSTSNVCRATTNVMSAKKCERGKEYRGAHRGIIMINARFLASVSRRSSMSIWME